MDHLLNIFYCMYIQCIESPCETLSRYYQSTRLKYMDITLFPDDLTPDVPQLTSITDVFINKLLFEINEYFPDGNIKNFDVFVPKNLPGVDDVVNTLSYGTREINSFCVLFKLNQCLLLLEDWRRLILSIVENSDYCQLREGSAISFWTKLMNMPSITWTERTRYLIQLILVIPVGSADAERGFSIMNHIRNKRRKSLTSEHLDALMRVRLNGPNNIERFSAIKYAKAWIKANHMRTDDPSQQKAPKTTNISEDEDEEDDNIEAERRVFKYMPDTSIF